MSQPKLSICIPTYNRARYLATLLTHLEELVEQLPFEVEIIVSDNASSDNTLELLDEARGRLPLLILQQSENLGSIRNMSCAKRAAKGEYLVYLADDDRLKPDALVDSITRLDANPKAAALYAPWEVLDLVSNEILSQFYKQSKNVTIPKGNYARLVEHVAEHRIFSEICILRRNAFRALHPVGNDLAYWAFTMPCEYLGYGDLIYAKTPFYISVARHFEGDTRAQEGFSEVMSAWDRYRGGAEYMYGLALQQGGMRDPARTLSFVHSMPIERMITALRFRIQQGRDPLENYAIAARIRGNGYEKHLPVPMEQIRTTAGLYFATVTLPDTVQAEGVAIIGQCDQDTIATLNTISNRPVRHVTEGTEIYATDVVLNLGCKDSAILKQADTVALAHVRDADLMRKFL